MKKGILLSLFLSSALLADYNVSQGWNFLGATQDINTSVFDNESINIVWTYDKNSTEWWFYTPKTNIKNLAISKGYKEIASLKSGAGFWLHSSSAMELELGDESPMVVPQNPYLVKALSLEGMSVFPIASAYVYNQQGQLVGETDSYGNLHLDADGTYTIKSDSFEDFTFYVAEKGVTLIKPDKKTNIKVDDSNNTYTEEEYVFDILDWNKELINTFIEAKVIPKVFLSASGNSGLLVRNFHVDTDVTMAIIEDLLISEPYVLAFTLELQNSLGVSITPEEVSFVGEFMPLGYKKGLDSTKQYALYYKKDDNASGWSFLQSVTYDANKGRLKPLKYENTLGQFAFKALDRINQIGGTVKDINGSSIEQFYVIEDNEEVHSFTNGEFSFAHTDTKKIKIFSDGYFEKDVNITDSLDIVLDKIPTNILHLSINTLVGVIDGNTTFNLEIEHNISSVPKLFSLTKSGEYYIAQNFPDILLDKNGTLNRETKITIKDNSAVIIPPTLQKLATNKKSIDYSDIIEYGDFLLNIASNGILEWYDKTTYEKLGEKSLALESVFDSSFVVGGYLFVGTTGGNIYKIEQNLSYEKVYETTGNLNSSIVDSKFLFRPTLQGEYLYYSTTGGGIAKLDLDGYENGAWSTGTVANKLYELGDKIISVNYNGKVDTLIDDTLTSVTNFNSSTPPNRVTPFSGGLVVATDEGIFNIDGNSLASEKKLDINATQIKSTTDRLFVKSESKIDIYDSSFEKIGELDSNSYIVEAFKEDDGTTILFTESGEMFVSSGSEFQKIRLNTEITNISRYNDAIFIKNKKGEILYFKGMDFTN